jgi:hypothetical protein
LNAIFKKNIHTSNEENKRMLCHCNLEANVFNDISHSQFVYRCPILEYELTDNLVFIPSGSKRCDFEFIESTGELGHATVPIHVPPKICRTPYKIPNELKFLCDEFLLTHNFSTFQQIENLLGTKYCPRKHKTILKFVTEIVN